MPGKIGRFEIMRTLGTGASCKVKLALDSETGRKVAVKIMNSNIDPKLKELVMAEVKAMSNLQHLNVVSQIEYGKGTYERPGKEDREVDYIVLELALGGELFDFIAISGKFSEPLARYYFKQFLEGIDYCHQAGIAHRDLKPENLLLDHQYTLKLADFGFAAPVEGRDGSGSLFTKLGTLNYMAPEIHLKQPYQGTSIDLFAGAIILFIMVAQHPPFTTAEPKDPFYRCLAANRADIFWKTHCQSKPEGNEFFSEDLKDIIQSMLQLDPAHRPSLTEIAAHKWLQGPTPTQEEVYAEFEKRNQSVQAQIQVDKAAKAEEKSKRVTVHRQQVQMRGAGEVRNEGAQLDMSEDALMKPNKIMEKYEKLFAQNTEFFSTYNPDMIEDSLKQFLENQQVVPTINKSKYKMKFTMTTKDQGGQIQNIAVCVRILNVDDKTVCVEFSRKDGDKIRFTEHFNELKNSVLACMNDAVVV